MDASSITIKEGELQLYEITKIIQEVRKEFEKLLNEEKEIREYVEDIIVLKLSEFCFLMMNFFQFCVDSLQETKIEFATKFKVSSKYVRKFEHIFTNIFLQSNLDSYTRKVFISRFRKYAQLYLKPQNFVDSIGGVIVWN